MMARSRIERISCRQLSPYTYACKYWSNVVQRQMNIYDTAACSKSLNDQKHRCSAEMKLYTGVLFAFIVFYQRPATWLRRRPVSYCHLGRLASDLLR